MLIAVSTEIIIQIHLLIESTYSFYSYIEKFYQDIDTDSTMSMNKLVSSFAHETREIAPETSFFLRSRNEIELVNYEHCIIPVKN